MTEIVDAQPTAAPEPFEYVEPIFGDSPEGTHVWQRVPYNADDYGPVVKKSEIEGGVIDEDITIGTG